MAMEITEILLSAQFPFGHGLSAAEETLEQLQKQNLPQFFLSLAVELSNDQKPPESRRLAGIILKNSLDAPRWVSVDLSIKAQIKDCLLQTLGSSVMEARHTSSQVIAKIAYIEIPRGEWQDLIERLLNNMKQQAAPAYLKQATLEALGYVCEEVSDQDLEPEQVNAVLSAVVQGMTQQEHSCEVRLAAVRSLYNVLNFAKSNFRKETERNYIMQVVCEAAISKELEIRHIAFECIVSIASMYYDILQPYMDKLFTLTANAVKVDEEPVALQAIEFWSAICDKEIEMQDTYDEDGAICDKEIEMQDTHDEDGDSDVPHLHFIQTALPSLVPLLLETLLRQEEDQDQDDSTWNLSIAGGTCLGLVAMTVGDAIVPLVLGFVLDNIGKPEWRNREAAIFAFGCILEGPSVEKLSLFFVHSGLEYLLNAIEDENSLVKDTTAWTLGRIFEILYSPNSYYPVAPDRLPEIINVLVGSLYGAPNVSEKVCGAIYFLAHAYEDPESDSSLLTPFFGDITSALLATADRMDTNSDVLRAATYEALNEIVWCIEIEDQTACLIDGLQGQILSKLSMIINTRDLKQSGLLALLCGLLQVIIQKLDSQAQTKSMVRGDFMMQLFMQVLQNGFASAQGEAMLAIGSLAYVIGPRFAQYMGELHMYLKIGLPILDYQACSISVGVIGDICCALDDLPYCDAIISNLLSVIRYLYECSPVPDDPLPSIFSCFGDIALAMGEHFEHYIESLLEAMQKIVDNRVTCVSRNEDMLEYQIQIMQGLFSVYSGILQGCKSRKAQLMLLYATHLVKLIESVFGDKPYPKHFKKYIEYGLEMLRGAAEHCVILDSSDEAMLENGKQLRLGIFKAYSVILQGLKSSEARLMLPYATHLLQFTEAAVFRNNRDERVTKAAAVVMGNLAYTLGPDMEMLFLKCTTCYEDVLAKSDDDQLKETDISPHGMLVRIMLCSMKIELGC